MISLRYTLISDGSSDRVLIHILDWLLHKHKADYAIEGQWADLRGLRNRPSSLPEKIALSCQLYPCEVVFVHRDAERELPEARWQEIDEAMRQSAVQGKNGRPSYVRVIPVKMTEAWLLFNEAAIRTAAGYPGGKRRLPLPLLKDLEKVPDPKETLFAVLKEASELEGRKLKMFRVHERVHRVAELIEDFSPLRELSAFRALEAAIQALTL